MPWSTTGCDSRIIASGARRRGPSILTKRAGRGPASSSNWPRTRHGPGWSNLRCGVPHRRRFPECGLSLGVVDQSGNSRASQYMRSKCIASSGRLAPLVSLLRPTVTHHLHDALAPFARCWPTVIFVAALCKTSSKRASAGGNKSFCSPCLTDRPPRRRQNMPPATKWK